MKKILSLFIVFSAFCGILLKSSVSSAFFLTKLLKSPSIEIPMPDFGSQAASLGHSAMELGGNIMKTKVSLESDLNKIKTAGISNIYNFNFSAKIDNTINPGQLEVVACKAGDVSVDIYDAASVQNALQKFFFQYPGVMAADIQNYDNYRDNFYEDTLIEIYTAARQLQADMDERVIPTLDEAQKCLTNPDGGCGIPGSNSNNEAAYTEAKALESIDNLLMVLQKAVALKAQLRAAKAIHKIEPRRYEAETVDDLNLSAAEKSEAYRLASSARIANSRQLAFAQLDVDSTDNAEEANSETEEDGATGQEFLHKSLTFRSAPESAVFHPFGDSSDEMAELTKLEPIEQNIDTATEAHNMIRQLSGYREASQEFVKAKERHRRSVEQLEESDRCTQSYIGRRFSSPAQVWNGTAPLALVTAHELRKGISGWSTAAYEAAKAAQVTTLTTDDTVAPAIDPADEAFADITNPEQTLEAFSSQQGTTNASPERQEQTEKENRITELLSWQTGSEASHLLASEPEKWGNLTTPFPVWNDTKSFYNQYLDGKYNNIKTYLTSFTTGDVLALIIAERRGENKDVSDTVSFKQQAQLNAKQTAGEASVSEARAAQEAAFAADSALQTLQVKRQAVLEAYEKASAEYKQLNDELSDYRQQMQEDAAEEVRDAAVAYDSFANYSVDSEASSAAVAGSDLNTEKEISSRFNRRYQDEERQNYLKDLENKVKEADAKVQELKKQLNTVDEQIAARKLEVQRQLEQSGNSFASQLAALRQSSADAKQNVVEQYEAAADANVDNLAEDVASSLSTEFAAQNPGKVYSGPTGPVLGTLLRKAVKSALNGLYKDVEARIDMARSQLAALGDDLYLPETHPKVVKIHQQMINDIKLMAMNIRVRLLGINSTLYLYAKLLSADTSADGEDFFVGSPAKARDLKAPHVVLQYNLPPLRETVHFDGVDFENVKPFDRKRTKSETILKADFLNYGGKIPEIWQYMLKDKAFVETDFDLKTALNTGCSQEAFFRGGFMPCKVKDSNQIIDVNADGEFIRGTASSGVPLSVCPNFEMRSGKIYDIYNDVDIRLGNGKKAPAADCPYSELGTLLDADKNNNIFFRKKTYEAFYTILKNQQDTESEAELKDAEKRSLAAYAAAPLSDNQIGDFLRHVDVEQQMRKQVEELQASHQQTMDDLRARLEEFGFEPAADFDISRDSDFELARSQLDNIKNGRLAEAQNLLQEVKTTENEVVSGRVDKLKRIIAALKKDKDEDLTITAAVVDNNTLDEDLKTAKVDNAAKDEYQKNVKAQQDKNQLAAAPYCSNY